MILSEDRVSHLAHCILEALRKEKGLRILDMNVTLRTIKESLANTLSYDEKIDEKVRAKLASYKRGIAEGSSEWDVLYKKFYEEELQKRK